MVTDQVFVEQLGSCLMQMECQSEDDLAYIDDPNEDEMCEMSMDLEDFKFDFDTISDLNLGPWIQAGPDDLKMNIADLDDEDFDVKSEASSADFEDLKITEAVRYDCMWSSNSSTPLIVDTNRKPQPLCENTLFEEFLKIIDVPPHLDIGIDPKEVDIKQEAKPAGISSDSSSGSSSSRCSSSSSDDCSDDEATKSCKQEQRDNDVRMFTSLDHCYVSSYTPTTTSTSSPSDRHTYSSSNYLVTPPESSEDEESQTSTSFPHVINPDPSRPQSLLKTKAQSVGAGGGEAKFCFRIKLKSDKSRSLLKQKFRLVNTNSSSSSSCSSSPVKRSSLGIMNKNMVQTSLRRRKEESLKMKHHEAREIHNHMERQRRNELKVSFDDLKACMPDIAKSEKVSKQMILDTALENSKLLKSRENSLRLRREKLKRRNAELTEQLKNLQRQRLDE